MILANSVKVLCIRLIIIILRDVITEKGAKSKVSCKENPCDWTLKKEPFGSKLKVRIYWYWEPLKILPTGQTNNLFGSLIS